MKIAEPKKSRVSKMMQRPYETLGRSSQQHTHFASWKTAPLTPDILTNIDENNDELKKVLVDIALGRFLMNRAPINTSFIKFLKNFVKFSVFSLLCACSYMDSAKVSSKGDIRTFIYVFLGFNILSSKYLDDYCVWNSSYVNLWGIDCRQASQIEIFVLKKLNYELGVDVKDVSKTLAEAICILET